MEISAKHTLLRNIFNSFNSIDLAKITDRDSEHIWVHLYEILNHAGVNREQGLQIWKPHYFISFH